MPNGYNISTGGTFGGSNKKPTTIDGILFESVGEADEYVAKLKGIKLSTAKKRVSKRRIHINKPAKAGESKVKTKEYRALEYIKHVVKKSGIEMIESWKEFDNFIQDVGFPENKDMAFTRLDKKKGYFPENCAWVTKSEASKN
jgi:hypothetical protein